MLSRSTATLATPGSVEIRLADEPLPDEPHDPDQPWHAADSAAAQTVQPELHLRPDKAAKYEVVAAVLASAQRLGLTRIGIIGSEQFIE